MDEFIKIALAQTLDLIPQCEGACDWDEFKVLIQNIINVLMFLAIPLATLMIIYGGVLLLISGGSEDRIRQGKGAIFSAVVGLAIVFGSYIIYNTVIQAISNR